MTSTNLSSSHTLPNTLFINNLAVGLDDSNYYNLPYANDEKIFVVGDSIISNNSIGNTFLGNGWYNFIANDQGIAVNTSYQNRTTNYQNFSAYIEGDLYVSGMISGPNSANLGAAFDLSSNSPFKYLNAHNSSTGYTTSYITIANGIPVIELATLNSNLLNLTQECSGANILKSHISINNTNNANMNITYLGNDPASPAIITTAKGSGGIEFHIGKTSTDFSNLYTTYTHDPNGSGNTVAIINSTPQYNNNSNAFPPNLKIDGNGNIGINIGTIYPISYNITRYDRNFELQYPRYNQPVNLHVDGTLFSSNILIYDYATESINNLDNIYIRSFGVSIDASNIRPGPFAIGNYSFENNLNINSNLYVNHDVTISNKLNVLNNAVFNNIEGSNLIIHDRTITPNLEILDKLLLNGDIWLPVPLDESDFVLYASAGLNCSYASGDPYMSQNGIKYKRLTYSNIDNFSNINVTAYGITTPGRFGIGMSEYAYGAQYTTSVPSQLTIIKPPNITDPNANNLWELQLIDQTNNSPFVSIPKWSATAYIGHIPTNQTSPDGSLVIATPPSTVSQCTFMGELPQNIYFYPGKALTSSKTTALVDQTSPPTLSILSKNVVLINNYATDVKPDPNDGLISSLDVNGIISFNNKLKYINKNDSNNPIQNVGLWFEKNNLIATTGNQSYYNGMIYNNSNAPFIGINTNPDINYSLLISGKLKSLDGYYDSSNEKLQYFIDRSTSKNKILYTDGIVGIGKVAYKDTDLDILGNNPQNPTQVRLNANSTNQSILNFNDSWNIKFTANGLNNQDIIQILQPKSLIPQSAILIQNNGKVSIAMDTNGNGVSGISNLDTTNNSVLTVGGSMSVLGDIYMSGQLKTNYPPTYQQQDNNSDGTNYTLPILGTEDVYIGGNLIYLSPSNSKNVRIQTNDVTNLIFNDQLYDTLPGQDNNKIFKIYSDVGLAVPFDQPLNIYSSAKNVFMRMSSVQQSMSGTTGVQSSENTVYFGITDNTALQTRPNGTIVNGSTFHILDSTSSSYISFNNLDKLDNLCGINTEIPYGLLHVVATNGNHFTSINNSGNIGENLLRLTTNKPISNQNNPSTFPEIYLEYGDINTYNYGWKIQGPKYYNQNNTDLQRLGLSYVTNTLTDYKINELFSFTNNSMFGIGNTNPLANLDILGNPSNVLLRLCSTNSKPNLKDAKIQLVFEMGDKNYGNTSTFGNDSYYNDYRMIASNNKFNFEMQKNNSIAKTIFNVNDNGFFGFGGNADTNNQVCVNGDLNIIGNLKINGATALAGNGTSQISFQELQVPNDSDDNNIRIIPRISKNGQYGGILLNAQNYSNCSAGNTSNLITVFSGYNENMMVLDSAFNSAQVHLKAYDTNNITKNIYRMEINKNQMNWKYTSNIDSTNINVLSSDNGYANVFSFQPSPRLYSTSSDFDATLNGSMILNSLYPNIYFGNNYTNYISGSSNNICLMTNNVGINTNNPNPSYLNINNSYDNNHPSIRIDTETSSGNVLEIYNQVNNKNPVSIIKNDGGILIGSNLYIDQNIYNNYKLQIITNTITPRQGSIIVSGGSINYPAYALTDINGNLTGGVYYTDTTRSIGLVLNGIETIRMQEDNKQTNQKVYINNNNIYPNIDSVDNSTEFTNDGLLTIQTNNDNNYPCLILKNNSYKSTNTFEVYNNSIGKSPSFIIDTNGRIGIGFGQPCLNNSFDDNNAGPIFQNSDKFYGNTINITNNNLALRITGDMAISGIIYPSYDNNSDFGHNEYNAFGARRWRNIFINKTIDFLNTNNGNATRLRQDSLSGNLMITSTFTSTDPNSQNTPDNPYTEFYPCQNDPTTSPTLASSYLQGIILKNIQFNDTSNVNSCYYNLQTTRIDNGSNFNFIRYSTDYNGATKTVNTYTPILYDTTKNIAGVGINTDYANASLHVASPNTNLILQQTGNNDILNVYNCNVGLNQITSSNSSIKINNIGNIAFGISNVTPSFVTDNMKNNSVLITSSNVIPQCSLTVIQLGNGPILQCYNTSDHGMNIDNYGNVLLTSNLTVNNDLNVFGKGNTASDKNLKTKIEKIDDALNKIKSLSGYTFEMIRNPGVRTTGLIAQEVQMVLPEAVTKIDDHLYLAYGNLMGLVVESIKELSQQINEIQAKLI